MSLLSQLTERQVRALGKSIAQALLAEYMRERALRRERRLRPRKIR